MEGGRVAETGTHAELLALDGTYARLWKLQQDSGKDLDDSKGAEKPLGAKRSSA